MTVRTIAQRTAQVESLWADNTSGDISEEDGRTVLIDNGESSVDALGDIPGFITSGNNVKITARPASGAGQNRTAPTIRLDIRGWAGVWSAAVGYSTGQWVRHGTALFIRKAGTGEVEPVDNAVNADEPEVDGSNTRWELIANFAGGGGGQPQPSFDTPVINNFSMSGLDITDGDAAGAVSIQAAISHPDNIRGNTAGGSANNAIGIEWSTDGNAYTSITSQVSETITKNGLQQGQTITLPTSNVAAGSSLYFRLFAYTTEATPSRIVSNALQFTREQAHEYAYGFQNEPNITWANWDIDSWDQRVSVQDEAYHVRMDLEGTVMNNYFVFLFPANREPERITNSLGQQQRVGDDANDLGTTIDLVRVRNAITVNSQAFTAYWTRNTNPQNVIIGIYFEFSRS